MLREDLGTGLSEEFFVLVHGTQLLASPVLQAQPKGRNRSEINFILTKVQAVYYSADA